MKAGEVKNRCNKGRVKEGKLGEHTDKGSLDRERGGGK